MVTVAKTCFIPGRVCTLTGNCSNCPTQPCSLCSNGLSPILSAGSCINVASHAPPPVHSTHPWCCRFMFLCTVKMYQEAIVIIHWLTGQPRKMCKNWRNLTLRGKLHDGLSVVRKLGDDRRVNMMTVDKVVNLYSRSTRLQWSSSNDDTLESGSIKMEWRSLSACNDVGNYSNSNKHEQVVIVTNCWGQ